MILRALRKNRFLTINYYENGLLQTCKGRVCDLNLADQVLFLEDEQHRIFSIRLAGIKEIS